MQEKTPSRRLSEALLGRTFGPAWLDYALIGGGISLLVTPIVVFQRGGAPLIAFETLPYIVLLSNVAHLAASAVRLYAKPGSFQALPFLTMAFPLVALGVLTVSMFDAARVGPHLQSLYLTWSPFHYCAQAYGLAVMYSYRSGCALRAVDKNMLWWAAMLPFMFSVATGPDVGLDWLVPDRILAIPLVASMRAGLGNALIIAASLAPLAVFVVVWRSSSGPMPLISLLAVVSNGVWFLVLAPLDAFVYATVFHSAQYLTIAIVFHVKEQMSRAGNRRGALYHGIWFYAMSLLLGYGVVSCLPLAYVYAGFGRVEAVMLVIAALNLHHFIVDAYVWKLGRSDGNRQIVESGTVGALAGDPT